MSLTNSPEFRHLVREDQLMGYGGYISKLHRLESRLRALMMALMAIEAGIKNRERDPLMTVFDQEAEKWDLILVDQYRKALAVMRNSYAIDSYAHSCQDLVLVQWSRFEELEIDGDARSGWEWLCANLPNYFEYLSGNREHVPRWEIWPLDRDPMEEERCLTTLLWMQDHILQAQRVWNSTLGLATARSRLGQSMPQTQTSTPAQHAGDTRQSGQR